MKFRSADEIDRFFAAMVRLRDWFDATVPGATLTGRSAEECEEAIPAVVAAGLLERIEDTRFLCCDSCHGVHEVVGDAKGGLWANCPVDGPCEIEPDALREWRRP